MKSFKKKKLFDSKSPSYFIAVYCIHLYTYRDRMCRIYDARYGQRWAIVFEISTTIKWGWGGRSMRPLNIYQVRIVHVQIASGILLSASLSLAFSPRYPVFAFIFCYCNSRYQSSFNPPSDTRYNGRRLPSV